jgi:hypothetical protein
MARTGNPSCHNAAIATKTVARFWLGKPRHRGKSTRASAAMSLGCRRSTRLREPLGLMVTGERDGSPSVVSSRSVRRRLCGPSPSLAPVSTSSVSPLRVQLRIDNFASSKRDAKLLSCTIIYLFKYLLSGIRQLRITFPLWSPLPLARATRLRTAGGPSRTGCGTTDCPSRPEP